MGMKIYSDIAKKICQWCENNWEIYNINPDMLLGEISNDGD